MGREYRSDLPPVAVEWNGFRGRINIKGAATMNLKERIAKELSDDDAAPYQTLCRIASLLELPWPSADRRAAATELEEINAARFRFAVIELLAGLLDEAVPLGDMYRFVDSTRLTLSERAEGIKEYVPEAAVATNEAARLFVDLLAKPYEKRAEDDEERA